MAHLRPEMCPIGAFTIYHHYIHDVKDITKALEIDWSLNSSWRQVRILIFTFNSFMLMFSCAFRFGFYMDTSSQQRRIQNQASTHYM